MATFSLHSLSVALAATVALTGLAAGTAHAQSTYPAKPIRLIIPFQGGVTEQLGRAYANELEKTLNQPIIVEVKPGAGGTIGSKYAARAKNDGYTLVIASNGLAINEAVNPESDFDPVRDLEPVAPLMSQPFLLIVKPDSELKDLKGYVQYAKANPRKVSYASVGPNTAAHLIGQFLMKETGAQLVHVAYKGGGAQALAVMSGEATSGYLTAAFVQPYLEAKTLRALAIIDDKRSPLFPDVPTAVEAGYPTLAPVGSTWFGVYGPKGLPADVKAKLASATDAIYRQGTIPTQIRKWGGEPLSGGAPALDALLVDGIRQWKGLLGTSQGN